MNELGRVGRLMVKPCEAAKLLSIGKTRLYELIQSGEIPVIRLPDIRIAVSDLEAWIEERRRSTGRD